MFVSAFSVADMHFLNSSEPEADPKASEADPKASEASEAADQADQIEGCFPVLCLPDVRPPLHQLLAQEKLIFGNTLHKTSQNPSAGFRKCLPSKKHRHAERNGILPSVPPNLPQAVSGALA